MWTEKLKFQLLRILFFLLQLPLVSRLFTGKTLFVKDYQDRYATHKRTKQRKVNLKAELDHYLKDVMPGIKHIDILDFRKEDFNYPTLKVIARDVLAILVSTMLLRVHLVWKGG